MAKNMLKRNLLTSIVATVLSASMLVGTTFAWFTDSVTSTNNVIQTGNLDVEMYYQAEGMSDWAKVTTETNVFKENALWELGHTEVVKLKVVNEGTLALKYQLGVNVANEVTSTNVLGGKLKLSDHIKYGVVDGAQTYNREQAVAAVDATATKLNEAYNSGTVELAAKNDTDSDEKIVTMVVYMSESVGNDANAKKGAAVPTIQLGINVFATQASAEDDSFDETYDEDAWNPGMQVFTASDLQAAITSGESVTLMNDITLTESIVIPAAKTSTYVKRAAAPAQVINLNGKTLSTAYAEGSTTNHLYAFENYGNIVITNGTINARGIHNYGKLTLESGTINAIDGNGGYGVRNYKGASFIMNGGTVATTLEDDNKVDAGGYDATTIRVDDGASFVMNNGKINNICDFTLGIDNHGETTINGGEITTVHSSIGTSNNLTVNGGTITCNGLEGITAHALWASAGTTTINGGTFNGKDNYNGFNVDASAGAIVNIYGGNFLPVHSGSLYGEGTITVKGGIFFDDVSARVASDYKAVESNGKYIVVADTIKDENVIGTPEQLETALGNAGAAGAGDTTLVFSGDIDMTNTTWTPINVDGYHGADIVTVEGNGATIKGLTAPLFAGGFAGGSGIVIKDLTIADSDIVSTNTIGSGAFIESVDSMAVITLNNCHLLNSTVTGGDGSRTGGLIGWTAGYSNVNDGPVKTYVTVEDCSVIGCTITCNGSVGGINGHAGNNDWTYTTIKNCVVKDNKLNSTDDGGWRVGVVVGTANVGEVTISNITESGNTLTQTGKTAPVGQSNLYGRFVPGTTGKLVIDGATVLAAATNAALESALANGATDISLPAGTYTLPNEIKGKEVTISGTLDTKVTVESGLNYINGADVTFEGVTIQSKPAGAGYENGFADAKYATFNNCVINGTIGLDFSCEFNDCTFNVSGNYYNVWTWGAGTATFKGCTFNCDGKALLVYANVLDNGTTHQTVNIIDCVFNDNGDDTVTGKAAIEVSNTYTPIRTYDVIIKNTKVNGFAQTVPGGSDFNAAYGSVEGANIGTNVWGNKCKLSNKYLNVVIDDVDVY